MMKNHEFNPLPPENVTCSEFAALPQEYSFETGRKQETAVNSRASADSSKRKKMIAMCASTVSAVAVTLAVFQGPVEFQTRDSARLADSTTVQLSTEANAGGSLQAIQNLIPEDGTTVIAFDFCMEASETQSFALHFDRDCPAEDQTENWGVLQFEAGETDTIAFVNGSTGTESTVFVRGQLDDDGWHHAKVELAPQKLTLTVDGTYVLGCDAENEADLRLTLTGSGPSLISGLEINAAPAKLHGDYMIADGIDSLKIRLDGLQRTRSLGGATAEAFLVYSEEPEEALPEELTEELLPAQEEFVLGLPMEPEQTPIKENLPEEKIAEVDEFFWQKGGEIVRNSIAEGKLSDEIYYMWTNEDGSRVIAMQGSFLNSTISFDNVFLYVNAPENDEAAPASENSNAVPDSENGNVLTDLQREKVMLDLENGQMKLQSVGYMRRNAKPDILDMGMVYQIYDSETGKSLGFETLYMRNGADLIYYGGEYYMFLMSQF